MKIRLSALTAAIVALAAALVFATAPPASARTEINKFGSWGHLNDIGNNTGWKVSSPMKSSDTIPNYPLMGQLWEARATVKSEQGTVTPIIPNLNARADNGQNYQVLWQAFTPNGISGATLAPGGESSGKLYFDVTGASPTTVAYNNGAEDLLLWEK